MIPDRQTSHNSRSDSRQLFADRILTCQDCGDPWVFTAGEQRFFHEKGLTEEPKRCKMCRAKRRRRFA